MRENRLDDDTTRLSELSWGKPGRQTVRIYPYACEARIGVSPRRSECVRGAILRGVTLHIADRTAQDIARRNTLGEPCHRSGNVAVVSANPGCGEIQIW